ncbi:MAG TPA: penicillin-binding protein 1C [Burkholderiales bacterium]|nr:penicillin-binding protein 1C [Burkholderiales bacterium]
MKGLAFVFLALAMHAAVAAVPAFDQVKGNWTSTEGILLDRHGALLHEMRVVQKGRRLDWTTLGEISPAALATIVRAEDKRFYAHHGVDWLALSDAALDTLLFSQPRGASTISMQVAGHLDPALRPARQKRSVSQKWDQISAARELEKSWSKTQILEAYLNLSTFRGELQGIGAASRALFGKEARGLDEPESLLLAVLLRGPNARPDSVAARACKLAASMDAGADCPRLQMLAQSALSDRPLLAPRVALAPHVARELLAAGRPRVQTTIDAQLQVLATELLQQQLAGLADRHVADAAALVLDNRTGDVLAYVGNAGNAAATFYVDGVRAPRQAGSTLKPFLYEMAIEKRLVTAASLLDDSPVNLVTPSGLYVPQNYDRDFKGLVSARTALSSSLNVPAVRTLMLVGADPFVERLQALRFDDVVHDGDFYGYSLALGSAEVSLWQLTNAYRALANGGAWSQPRLTSAMHTASTPVFDASAAWIVSSILSDPLARSVTFGLENPLASRYWTAVKTGTSKDMRDNWCVGFSDAYTVGVWVGNFDGSPMHDVSGVTGAAPVWAGLIDYLHRGRISTQPKRPQDVVASQVFYEGEIESAREEYFLDGTQVERVSVKPPESARAGIAYPGDGSIIALDPDIPDGVQRVRFLAVPAQPGQRWRLDGESFGDVDAPALWPPRPGRHVLALVDAGGVEVDRVRFEVRGNPGSR